MRPMAAPGQIAMSKDGCPDGSEEVAAPQGLKSQLAGKNPRPPWPQNSPTEPVIPLTLGEQLQLSIPVKSQG
jgi:hypothetical protein